MYSWQSFLTIGYLKCFFIIYERHLFLFCLFLRILAFCLLKHLKKRFRIETLKICSLKKAFKILFLLETNPSNFFYALISSTAGKAVVAKHYKFSIVSLTDTHVQVSRNCGQSRNINLFYYSLYNFKWKRNQNCYQWQQLFHFLRRFSKLKVALFSTSKPQRYTSKPYFNTVFLVTFNK